MGYVLSSVCWALIGTLLLPFVISFITTYG